LGADVLIADTDFHPITPVNRRYEPIPNHSCEHRVVIADDVFIGARSIILKGVSIGAGAVVGAGSVVANDVPAKAVVAGSPARVLRYLDKSS
jgi:acetyltransferase-like isoleucine patch superfamily enzyme